MIARLMVLATAAAAIFFLAVWFADARHFEHARTEVLTARTPAQVSHTLAELESAERLSPSTLPELEQATLLYRVGSYRASAAKVRDVLRREPRNPSGWAVLALDLRNFDPAGAAAALRRLDELNPRRASAAR